MRETEEHPNACAKNARRCKTKFAASASQKHITRTSETELAVLTWRENFGRGLCGCLVISKYFEFQPLFTTDDAHRGFRPAHSSSNSMGSSCFCMSDIEILPPAGRSHPLDLGGTPRVRLIAIEFRTPTQQGIDNPPRFFHIIFACKQRRVPRHRVTQYSFIRVHFLGIALTACGHLRCFSDQLFPWCHGCHSHRDRNIRTDAEAEIIGGKDIRRYHGRRLSQAADDFRTGCRQAFSSSNVEWNALPAPGINLQLERHEGLYLRVGRHALFCQISSELPPNDICRFQRRDCLEDLHLLIADRFALQSDRRFHGQVAEDLK